MDHQEDKDSIPLTAAEITNLWNMFQYETLALCGMKYFSNHVEDEQVQQVLEKGMQLSKKRKTIVVKFFEEANYPIPQGFTEHDVNLNAPRIFSDQLYLHYLLSVTELEYVNYGAAVVNAVRTDVIEVFANTLMESQNLHIRLKELMKEKGLLIRTPSIPAPNQIDFVEKESFLKGWLGEQRPLIGSEITELVYNAKRNALGEAVITAFSQVAQSKEVRRYFEKGRDIARKHVGVFTSILNESYLGNAVVPLSSEVTDSTEAPFSDKLMLTFISTLIGSGIGSYGKSISTSPRRDIAAQYTRLMAEIAKYAEDGIELLIENEWMEQPPIAADRKGLAK
ncbi:DUF3231 family protein [Virgibacillus sp. W0181]|uniref:DUF3231 family protein n=1 Tax=Virgibacillus sp. W0181 TaxID=3391581 RepID=UPI003F487F1A